MITKETFIVPLLGLYQVTEINGRSEYICVMKNLFSISTDRIIDEIFDLKGSKLDRMTPPENRKPGVPLKDLDFGERVILLPRKTSKKILQQLTDDATFLSQIMKTMDYSMLVGIHISSKETIQDPKVSNIERDGGYFSLTKEKIYYFGIIDYLVEYDTKKHLETMVKEFRAPKEEISSLSPELYASRWVKYLTEKMSWSPKMK